MSSLANNLAVRAFATIAAELRLLATYTQQVEDLDLVAVIQAVNKVDGNKITLVRQPMVFGAPGENVEIKS